MSFFRFVLLIAFVCTFAYADTDIGTIANDTTVTGNLVLKNGGYYKISGSRFDATSVKVFIKDSTPAVIVFEDCTFSSAFALSLEQMNGRSYQVNASFESCSFVPNAISVTSTIANGFVILDNPTVSLNSAMTDFLVECTDCVPDTSLVFRNLATTANTALASLKTTTNVVVSNVQIAAGVAVLDKSNVNADDSYVITMVNSNLLRLIDVKGCPATTMNPVIVQFYGSSVFSSIMRNQVDCSAANSVDLVVYDSNIASSSLSSDVTLYLMSGSTLDNEASCGSTSKCRTDMTDLDYRVCTSAIDEVTASGCVCDKTNINNVFCTPYLPGTRIATTTTTTKTTPIYPVESTTTIAPGGSTNSSGNAAMTHTIGAAMFVSLLALFI